MGYWSLKSEKIIYASESGKLPLHSRLGISLNYSCRRFFLGEKAVKIFVAVPLNEAIFCQRMIGLTERESERERGERESERESERE